MGIVQLALGAMVTAQAQHKVVRQYWDIWREAGVGVQTFTAYPVQKFWLALLRHTTSGHGVAALARQLPPAALTTLRVAARSAEGFFGAPGWGEAMRGLSEDEVAAAVGRFKTLVLTSPFPPQVCVCVLCLCRLFCIPHRLAKP
jgi:hypothetical protein